MTVWRSYNQPRVRTRWRAQTTPGSEAIRNHEFHVARLETLRNPCGAVSAYEIATADSNNQGAKSLADNLA